MKIQILITIVVLFSFTKGLSQRVSLIEYIETYKNIAIEEMKRSGIPASITLAQGIVESAYGNSTLARQANNHFGIKCHKWDKEKFYWNDDAHHECFRKYSTPEESFRDHTDFLINTPRYQFLFQYKSDDYKSWAHGLQKAGYATNKKYATDLIRTIEENKLYVFDSGEYNFTMLKNKSDSDQETIVISAKTRKIYEKNRIKYIRVEKNDNLVLLTKELDLFPWQLKKYNDLPENYELQPGEILYIQPKRCRAETGYEYHMVKKGETMHSISQLYGIKLNKLYQKNRMEPGTKPVENQKIYLRKRKPKSELLY